MRQWAWLGATPDKARQTRIEAIRSRTLQERSYNEDGSVVEAPTEIHLPEIPSAYESLLGIFFDSGQAMQTGTGLVPLTWQEIQAFREENELDLCVFERELLKKMSEAYCAEASRATDPRRPAPYKPAATEIDEVEKARNIRESFLSAFRKK